LPLKGKVALVTGATRGIGLAFTQALASEGCNLVICGRDTTRLKNAKSELNRKEVRVLAQACDVRDENSVTAMLGAVRQKFRRLDILVNNAGITHAMRPVRELPSKDWNDVIATTLSGMFLVTKHALQMMDRGSTIVNVLSISAKRVFPGQAAYNAAKHGALGFTNTLREELRAEGIRVIALLPGATETPIWETLWPEAPRKQMLRPETVAQALVHTLKFPPESTVEEIMLMPTTGVL
jgi:NAD(P)-dependent dehydrogenase (short-subunit alcohol dehydrogenase family)